LSGDDKTRTKYFRQPLDPHGYTHYIKVWEKLITPSGVGIMRKNLQEVFKSWIAGAENAKQKSIWTDGDTIYSYGTALATFGDNLGEAILNRTKYTRTTSAQQGALAYLLGMEFENVLELDGLPMGISSSALFNRAVALHS
jgi:hypothetical protein